ncbi:excinuclease ABC subunit UvrA [Actinocorallia longicatena]|uniref:UvrABC system protein A n=1 Tax=Actinocorallia longicatena TaxID=111803 RepID=A0ABP6Q7H2_9ACTN
MDEGMVRVRGAAEHNLRDVDLEAPRDRLVAFTGVSGSGKSSLAFTTIYAEAQRRYLESVSPYARRLIEQVAAPKVTEITGLPPAVALRQTRGGGSSRSSVGTVTQLSDLLRMLFSRVGDQPEGTPFLDSDAFSPNTVAGACPECHGRGRVHEVDADLMVPDPGLSIRDGAIAAWPGAWQGKNYRDILAELGFDVDAPWRELPAEQREWILTTAEQPVVTVHPVRDADRITRDYQGTYSSARRYVLHTFATTRSDALRARAARFIVFHPCPACGGKRLRPEALAVKLAGRDIAEFTALPLTELAAALSTTGPRGGAAREAAELLVGGLADRIGTLVELGLGHLSIDRSTDTLSAGELQRLRLGAQLRSGLFGVLFVLDEPSAGLHPSDVSALLAALYRLRAAGNSVFLVEHDLDLVADCDWIVDVGPGAGAEGGRVLYSGALPGLKGVPESVTGRYLAGAVPDPVRRGRRPGPLLELRGVGRNNLRDVTASFPLGLLTVVTGVSGSGKTTLVGKVLAEAVTEHLDGGAPPNSPPGSASGLEAVDRLVVVDQKPIGRTPRSNIATYTGLFDLVRRAFATTPEARRLGYGAGRFSFNVQGGRCENCQGEGLVHIEMLFLPEATAVCPVCAGARYNDDTLRVRFRDHTIAGILDLTVGEAAVLLGDLPAAGRTLTTLDSVGLGYLRLGQPATTLSGGEAQRVKLAAELQRGRRGHTLYLLDEPTTGLHPADTDLLLSQLDRLVEEGGTVVMVEHDMRVAAAADWIIDLGPGGGEDGGRIVAAGTPADVARSPLSRTAPHLRARLPRNGHS